MKTVLKATIYGHPYIKENYRKTIFHNYLKKPIIVYTAQYTAWENDALKQMLGSRYRLNIDYPIMLECHFFRKTKHKKNLSTMYQSIQDILVKAGTIKNDKIIIGHDGSRIHYDKEHPRVEFRLLKVEQAEK